MEALPVEIPNQAAIDLFDLSYSAVEHFAQMLIEEGETRGLIGPRELPRLWSRHLVNSAAIVPFIPADAQMLDVGSGAGFPGVVAAIMRPDVDVHLVEPMLRRIEWLADVVEELGLDNVTLHQKRAEELHGHGKADIVTSRAVANLSKLIPITLPLVRGGGSLLALKGRKAKDEVAQARRLFKKFGVVKATVHEVPSVMEDESTMVVQLKRAK
ncbi:16S rRNA (guanine(527)-N(7))-methyltransferase RsmG [Gleimia sp. 6138-11-ORH1]|nr:16S rRNA (guanine(527)-N(7))-methyltransferase RsmG [Gleimia sp. 6138-11-ORH1]MCS4485135.1 16S rRNA (guanine(527)-N(7))-methyltransferase RsmG [Gleimia sp. 6138-11-ORH1]